MPKEIIKAFAYLKHGAALANNELGVLPKEKSDLIGTVCVEILEGKLDDQFPLVVWQTGSGTQSNIAVPISPIMATTPALSKALTPVVSPATFANRKFCKFRILRKPLSQVNSFSKSFLSRLFYEIK